jgi:transglutaminase-like putative cysteine protease
MLFALFLHPSRTGTILEPECLSIEPHLPYTTFTDAFQNVVGRMEAPQGRVRFVNYAVVEDDGLPDPVSLEARQLPVTDLPPETLQFLLASRYCEVDSELSELAWDLFGKTKPGWSRVQAICDFVHQHLQFDYLKARPTRTALQAYQEKTGVCRDFMHLAITLCRCLNIPARYATGYLGDIGVEPAPYPMDFSAWFQVYLEDRWHTFDARHNERRIGRVLMATGRDAADVALTTIFGPNLLTTFKVITDEVQPAKAKRLKAPVKKKAKNTPVLVA